ncbi:hypothetical protein PG994_008131 [Apiospora phragmitis]|uniref:Uncharacterized protein n=1 Tax=Apiospora phragmitis TaxID=2905665 RepID=A0ABR1US63_9PEZI
MADPRPDSQMHSTPEHNSNPIDIEKDELGHQDQDPATSGSEEARNEKVDHGHVDAQGRRELKETDCPEILAYAWPTWKKWMYLSAVAGIQISMNYNTSVFPSAIKPLSAAFQIGEQGIRVGQMIYLVLYSFGCELWAPWSEEFGRWPILQLSMFLINIWQIPCALAPNWGTIVVCRALGGLSTAGGSVTLGLIADLYQPEEQQWPLAFIVLSSCIGTSIGGVIGGPIQRFLEWQWFFWIMLIFGGAVQAIFFFMPESRATILLDREAKRRRKTGQDPNIYGPNELKTPRISLKEAGIVWIRPFEMFVREPIVLSLSLLSGFSDALIFTFLESFPKCTRNGTSASSRRPGRSSPSTPRTSSPQGRRLVPAGAPTEGAAVAGAARAHRPHRLRVDVAGPAARALDRAHALLRLVGIANYAIYFSSVDYMIAAYGVYSASACGGNAFARDFLAGISAMYATPMYTNIDGYPVEYASTILAGLSVIVVIPIYVFYWKGPVIRDRSKFAKTLAEDRKKVGVRRLSKDDNLPV